MTILAIALGSRQAGTRKENMITGSDDSRTMTGDRGEAQANIDIETPIHATESMEKVRRAITNLFPDARFEEEVEDGAGLVRADSWTIGTLKERLAVQQIRDSARSVLLKGIRPGHLYFTVSKQAAYAGKVSFGNDGPLGDIVVIIRTETPEAVVDELTDRTEGADGA